ncbi:hypothetical protein DCCM_2993 [Desulfocucumis palustris]|uniref:Uncharacterized protein n=1 Tax=Desulfocucumis palustris TaxID=1898651 RepID=A0A2L2XCN7_9FIRM|nr:hypothetical protein DCCM_2993 [Desulfocucumis palustris]
MCKYCALFLPKAQILLALSGAGITATSRPAARPYREAGLLWGL